MSATELEERVRHVENTIIRVEAELKPLFLLSTQLATLSGQLVDLKTELASFKGRATGTAAVIGLIVPAVVSASVAFLFHALSGVR